MAGMNDEGRQWYVVCTYNGHENKVKENLEKRIESMGLQDCLYNIIIPEHVETIIKDGKKINKVNSFQNLFRRKKSKTVLSKPNYYTIK